MSNLNLQKPRESAKKRQQTIANIDYKFEFATSAQKSDSESVLPTDLSKGIGQIDELNNSLLVNDVNIGLTAKEEAVIAAAANEIKTATLEKHGLIHQALVITDASTLTGNGDDERNKENVKLPLLNSVQIVALEAAARDAQNRSLYFNPNDGTVRASKAVSSLDDATAQQQKLLTEARRAALIYYKNTPQAPTTALSSAVTVAGLPVSAAPSLSSELAYKLSSLSSNPQKAPLSNPALPNAAAKDTTEKFLDELQLLAKQQETANLATPKAKVESSKFSGLGKWLAAPVKSLGQQTPFNWKKWAEPAKDLLVNSLNRVAQLASPSIRRFDQETQRHLSKTMELHKSNGDEIKMAKTGVSVLADYTEELKAKGANLTEFFQTAGLLNASGADLENKIAHFLREGQGLHYEAMNRKITNAEEAIRHNTQLEFQKEQAFNDNEKAQLIKNSTLLRARELAKKENGVFDKVQTFVGEVKTSVFAQAKDIGEQAFDKLKKIGEKTVNVLKETWDKLLKNLNFTKMVRYSFAALAIWGMGDYMYRQVFSTTETKKDRSAELARTPKASNSNDISGKIAEKKVTSTKPVDKIKTSSDVSAPQNPVKTQAAGQVKHPVKVIASIPLKAKTSYSGVKEHQKPTSEKNSAITDERAEDISKKLENEQTQMAKKLAVNTGHVIETVLSHASTGTKTLLKAVDTIKEKLAENAPKLAQPKVGIKQPDSKPKEMVSAQAALLKSQIRGKILNLNGQFRTSHQLLKGKSGDFVVDYQPKPEVLTNKDSYSVIRKVNVNISAYEQECIGYFNESLDPDFSSARANEIAKRVKWLEEQMAFANGYLASHPNFNGITFSK